METHSIVFEWLQNMGLPAGSIMWILGLGFVLAVVLLAVIMENICRHIILPIVRKITSKTQSQWDDYLLNDSVIRNLCQIIPATVASMCAPLVFEGDADATSLFQKLCTIYMTVVIVKMICSIISSIYTISSEHESLKNHSLKGFYQMLKLVVVCVGAIIIISTLIDKNPIAILTGLGAGTAILMLVFQDTIKGLVAGIQLMANDMLRPGDWITMPKYGADGDVLEVTLTTVKVQNWDKTITTIPPYALVSESFQNWRGMFDSGGRRIKRSIYIDMNTVSFCDAAQVARLKAAGLLTEEHDKPVNLTIFREWLELWLKNHPKVNKRMITMVRQLQPTAQGLPLELYFFFNGTAWVDYEHLQSEVFEYITATLPQFGLKAFQSPTGNDIKGFAGN